MSRVSIHIVTWNSMEYLPDLLASVFAQTFGDFTVRVVDNASTDGVVEFLRDRYPQVMLIRNANNLGFSSAHNQAIRFAMDRLPEAERPHAYILVTNPDVVMTPTCLERLLAEADQHPKAGSLGGKLLRAFGENLHDETLKEKVNSELIDSTGFRADRRRVFAERGAGEVDRGQYDEKRDVFGISGALALYRASALQDVKIGEEYFDEDFFAYKEDVDVAWRLLSRGWMSRYVPEAVAYHYRGMYGKERAGLLELIRNRRKKSSLRSFYSTRNHEWLLFKNLTVLDWLLAFPWIAGMETARFIYVCLFESANLRAFGEALAKLPKMWRKRCWIMKKRKVNGRELRQWFL